MNAHQATEQIHDVVDQMTEAIKTAQTNRDEGQRLAYDAARAGIDTYLENPKAVSRTLAAIAGDRAPAAGILTEAIDRVQSMALHRLAQEAETRDVKTSFSGIANIVTVPVGDPDRP